MNATKTEILWCTSSCRQHQLPTNQLTVGNDQVIPVTCFRNLGIYMDTDLSMRIHVLRTTAGCFAVLCRRNVPYELVSILFTWFSCLRCCVSWNSLVSHPFPILRGVRQGGILSPCLFAIRLDDLITNLHKCRCGLHIDSLLAVSFMPMTLCLCLFPATPYRNLLMCALNMDWNGI